MTVFYDRQSVLVTDQMFTMDDALYVVYEIEDVRVDPRRINSAVRFTAMLVPVPLAAVGLAGAVGGLFFVVLALVALVLSLSAVIAVAVAQARPQKHELWILYDGGLQKVFETREEWRVKQLARALRRAIEASHNVALR